MVTIKIMKPCCKLLQERLMNQISKIQYNQKEEIFEMHNGEGMNPETVYFCPYCGESLEVYD